MSDETTDNILRLARDGVSDRAISGIVGIPGTRVQTIRLRHRILRPITSKSNGQQLPEPPAPKQKPNPITDSAHWLGGRLREVPGKGFFLDGVPTSTGDVVRAANRMRVNMGVEQIGPEIWRVSGLEE